MLDKGQIKDWDGKPEDAPEAGQACRRAGR